MENKEFAKERILELIQAIMDREELKKDSIADLGFIKIYLKKLTD
jgi:hypothetical protein